MNTAEIQRVFADRFGGEGTFYASAGQINLIAEHTDYNGGFVFPGAVDCGITTMIRSNGTEHVRVADVDLNSAAEFGLCEEDLPAESWARYVFGGCTINLVRAELYDDFVRTARERFAARYGHEPKVYDVVISDGARKIEKDK